MHVSSIMQRKLRNSQRRILLPWIVSKKDAVATHSTPLLSVTCDSRSKLHDEAETTTPMDATNQSEPSQARPTARPHNHQQEETESVASNDVIRNGETTGKKSATLHGPFLILPTAMLTVLLFVTLLATPILTTSISSNKAHTVSNPYSQPTQELQISPCYSHHPN